MNLIKSFFIGLVGDAILQVAVCLLGDLAGLKPYFRLHGIFESLLIGAGVMFIATWLYTHLGLPINILNLFIYGGILDILWRQLNLMPSLQNTYYKALNPISSFIWGGIPMVLILLF